MIELATNTITAESKIAPHSADNETMPTSSRLKLETPQSQARAPRLFRPRGYPTPHHWSRIAIYDAPTQEPVGDWRQKEHMGTETNT